MNMHLDLLFNSLADSTSRDILKRLVQQELSVSQVAVSYDMSLAVVSKHLKVLEKSNLLCIRREGKKYIPSANIGPLKMIDSWIDYYRVF